MRAVVDFGFANRQADELMADADPRNDASRRLLKRLGFHFSHHAKAMFCIDGDWVDNDRYGLPRSLNDSQTKGLRVGQTSQK